MDFQIISFNPQTARVIVECADMQLAIDLPIDDEGNVPEGPALEQFIMGFIPVEALRRKRLLEKWGGVRNAAAIEALVAPPDPALTTQQPAFELYINDIALSSI